jgi:hypothetical protein
MSIPISKEMKQHLNVAQKYHIQRRQDFEERGNFSTHETTHPEQSLLNIPLQDKIREIVYNLAYECAYYDVFKSKTNAEHLFLTYQNCLKAIHSYHYDSFMNAPLTLGRLPHFYPDRRFNECDSKCNYFSIYTGFQTTGKWESYRQFIGDRKLSDSHLEIIKAIEKMHIAFYSIVYFDTIIERSKLVGYYDLTKDDVYPWNVDDLLLYRHVNTK